MPWKKESVVEQRLRFLIAARSRAESITELCRRYEISRKTGYKWLQRYNAGSRSKCCVTSRVDLNAAQGAAAELGCSRCWRCVTRRAGAQIRFRMC